MQTPGEQLRAESSRDCNARRHCCRSSTRHELVLPPASILPPARAWTEATPGSRRGKRYGLTVRRAQLVSGSPKSTPALRRGPSEASIPRPAELRDIEAAPRHRGCDRRRRYRRPACRVLSHRRLWSRLRLSSTLTSPAEVLSTISAGVPWTIVAEAPCMHIAESTNAIVRAKGMYRDFIVPSPLYSRRPDLKSASRSLPRCLINHAVHRVPTKV